MARARADAEHPDHRGTDSREKQRTARMSVASNASLVTLKLTVGFWTGSMGVLSEALHSGVDLVASAVTFFSVRASDTPADWEHPYGHGKIESLSGLIEAFLIAGATPVLIWEALQHLVHPRHGSTAGLNAAVGVMAFSALLNAYLSRRMRRASETLDSIALKAESDHLWSDVITSAGVLAGLVLQRVTGIAWIDPIVALLVASLILRTAVSLFLDALHPLMDMRLPPQEEGRIEGVLDDDPRVLGYHKLRTRKSGSERYVDVHVQIDDACSLVEAHDLSEELEDAIRGAFPSLNVSIHIEPYHSEADHQREAHGLEMLPAGGEPIPSADPAIQAQQQIDRERRTKHTRSS